MDSSSSMPSPAATPTAAPESNNNNREGALSPIAASPRSSEDDMAFSVHAGLAKEALLHFQSGKFAECVHFLNQLLQKKENDPKIIHNIAIAESFQDGCSDPKKLLEVLNNVKKRSEELARASEEQQSESGGNTSKATVGNKGNSNTALSFSSSSGLPVVYSDEYDTSIAMFNMAVIWFHLHEYAKSYAILDSFYQNIEPLDEGTALRICLLLLDVALVSNNASKAADVISYMEKVFCAGGLTNQVDNGNSSHQSNIMSKSSLPSIPDTSNSDSGPSASALESSLSRTLSDEGLEDESLLSSLTIGGDNLSRPILQSVNDSAKNQIEDSLSTMDLRLKLHLYKVSFLLLMRNLKAAKREVKMAMNIARGKDYTMALYLKSQLEYARGNHRKAIKLLMASGNRSEAGISSIFYNNLGCIYYRLGKYHSSSVMFSKALSNIVALRKEKPRKLAPLSQDKSTQVLYNCGLTFFEIGKPLPAARYFHRASLVSYKKPVLWLRIAECCLMALEKGLLKSNYSTSDGSDVKVNVVGQGKLRELALLDSRAGKSDYVGKEDFSFSSDGPPVLSVTLARQCLLNAFYLLESSDLKNSSSDVVPCSAAESSESGELLPSNSAIGSDSKGSNTEKGSSQVNMNGEVKEQKNGIGQNTPLLNSVSDYEDICRKENQLIKQAVLADMAYVELQLGNPLKALSAAMSLLKLSECTKIYLFLGNMYAAEALCYLNRPKEAAEHLRTYVDGGDNVELPYTQDDFEKWRVEKVVDYEDISGGPVAAEASDESEGFKLFLKPEEARGAVFANQAAWCACIGDIERAQYFIDQALSILPDKGQVIVTAVYLDVLQGRTENAVARLKQYRRVKFLPGSVTLEGSS
ncbi:OLC1v1038037C1 [Oldenlandia corymbosa var. corymbosa]|uniref:OLC1v1038037C1 n=1 Tax=Oldenlandia corymbosa var. corymbosa TaxID=529605 RepID=A0AAV1CZH5_OLDCO|nr:OLC1v1038037C1 [Oldenlandia corymbosa var. corymbosa]